MKKHEPLLSAQVHFDQVSVYYFSRPSWLGGKAFKALEELTLTISTQNLAIVGPSGAGKSTLIELLFGLRQPSGGEVYVCGYPLSHRTAKQRKVLCQHIQLIPQEPLSSLNPYYTVRQILLEPLYNIGEIKEAEQKVKQALLDVGLDLLLLDRHSQQLSVGQAQRVAIARALIVEPCVLVADEPTSSLDPVSRQQIIDLLRQLQKTRHMRLILVTHDINAAMQLCDELLVLDNGQVVEHGTKEQVSRHPTHKITKALLSVYLKNNEFTKTIGEVSYAS